MARHFPDFLEAYLEFTQGHEGTRRVQLWSCASILAATLERKVWMNRGFYLLFPNLYVFIIGRSGLIKKSTSTGIAVDLFRELRGPRLMSERLTAASLIHQMSLAGRKFELQGMRIRQSALFAYASELSVFLEEVNGNILDLLTTFYDCTPNDPNKPWVYATKNKGTTTIYGPCLNMLAASTKAWLKKCLPRAEQEGGFTSRVLFVVENNPPERLVAWPESHEDSTHRRRLIDDLNQIASLAGVVAVDPGTKKIFAEWYDYHMREVVPRSTDPAFSGYLGRKGDLLLKISMVKMVSEGNTLKLTPKHLEWAGHELELLEVDMKTAFYDYTMPVSSEIVFDVLQFVKAKTLTDRAELKKVFANKAPTPMIEKAINELLQMKEIEAVERVPPEGGYAKVMLQICQL